MTASATTWMLGALPLATALVAGAALEACADGTTPDCSGDASPCGYPQSVTDGAAEAASTGGGE